MENRNNNKLFNGLTGVCFAVGVISMLAAAGVDMFSPATTFDNILPNTFQEAVGALFQILLLYIGIEGFSRAYSSGFTLGYKVDGALLAICVLYAFYFGSFINAMATLGIVIGVVIDVIATRNMSRHTVNA